MILVTEAGYQGIVALSACSTRPLSASTTSHASLCALFGTIAANAARAMIFSGALPSNERINCTIRFRFLRTRLILEGIPECDLTGFKRVRRRRLRQCASYTGLPFENRGLHG